jgi:hypothetical protein
MPRSDTLGGNLHLHHGDAIGYEGATVQELAEACDVDVEEMTFTLIASAARARSRPTPCSGA